MQFKDAGTADSKEGFGERSSPIPSTDIQNSGGAIKGINNRLVVNSINSTIPLPVSPPGLYHYCNSGQGNSSFGMGWVLCIPSISSITKNKLPQHFNWEESDTFY